MSEIDYYIYIIYTVFCIYHVMASLLIKYNYYAVTIIT